MVFRSADMLSIRCPAITRVNMCTWGGKRSIPATAPVGNTGTLVSWQELAPQSRPSTNTTALVNLLRNWGSCTFTSSVRRASQSFLCIATLSFNFRSLTDVTVRHRGTVHDADYCIHRTIQSQLFWIATRSGSWLTNKPFQGHSGA